MAYGQWAPLVDAGPARRYALQLIEQGCGTKSLAKLAGVQHWTIVAIVHGGRDRPPRRRILARTAGAILSVRPSLDDLLPCAAVDGTGTRRRLQALIAKGHTQVRIAGRVGKTPTNLGRILRARGPVHVATVRAVREVYRELWDQDPPETTAAERVAARHARELAEARGWPLPAAWDDDEIDDPAGKPADGWQRSRSTWRSADLAEDALELIGRHYTRRQAAVRLGVTVAAIEKALERTGQAAA